MLWSLLCLVLHLAVGQCFPFQLLPCPSACLPACPASESAWHRALGIGPASPPLSSPTSFLSYCHAWSVPGPPLFRRVPGQFFYCPPCRDKEAGWGGRTRSVVILRERKRLTLEDVFMRAFQLGKTTGRRASFGRALLLCQLHGILLLRSQQDHPLLKGSSGQPSSTFSYSFVLFSHPKPKLESPLDY